MTEVCDLLKTTRILKYDKRVDICTVTYPPPAESTQLYALNAINNNFARIIGQGIFKFSTINVSASSQMIVPDLPLSVYSQDGEEIILDQQYSLELLNLPYFYLGISTGLSIIHNEHTKITSSWILFNNKSTDLNKIKHAGLLCGLGLNGYLKLLSRYEIYCYLNSGDPYFMTSLLIGLGASYMGTKDKRLTSSFMLHLPSLSHCSLISLTVRTKMSAIIGLGLLYFV